MSLLYMYLRMPTRILFFVLIVLITAVHCFAQTDDDTPFHHERFVVHGNGSCGPYQTVKRFIGGTLVVESSSGKTTPDIASWDVNERTVIFDRIIADNDSIVIICAVPPQWLSKSYTRSVIKKKPGKPVIQASTSYRKQFPRPFRGLNFGGSKTFDITTGTDRSAALNQTLRLNISGNITDDITLNAAISDQNVPITPEGDTRELNELDRVLIELRGKNFSADMGDTDLKRQSGRWMSYSRRLSGAHLKFQTGSVSFFGSGAVSEGRYMSTTITPVEGNQGPYRLIARDGNSLISIVPGTERIWINGEKLTRGYNFDYTIDYTTGEITFSEIRIIGSDMRIVCDYEYTSESYRRTFFSGGSDGEFFNSRLKISISAAREADDPDRTVYADLDDISRRILSEAGDTLATVSGIRPAESDSTGSYDIIDGYLVFNPLGKGTHNATFSWVGENEGSYRYRGGGIYEFVPEDERIPGSGASYEPIAVIKGPVTHGLAGITVAFDPVPSLHLETEFAGSSFDRNSLSGVDDSDNNGGAYRIEATLSPKIQAGLPLQIVLRGKHHSQEKTFMPLDRDRTAEENRQWGLPLVTNPDKEAVTEFSGGFFIKEGIFSDSGLNFNSGRADFGDSTVSSRYGAESRLRLADHGEARFAMNHITRENFTGLPDETINRLFGEANARLSGFTSSALYEGERTNDRGSSLHGTAYDDIHIRLGAPEFFGIKSEAEWLYRIERAKHQSWKDSSTVRGGSIELTIGSNVNSSLRTRYARRERISQSQSSASDQALVEGYIRPFSGSAHIQWSYRAGRSREASRRKNFLYTGGGRGSYRWEDNNEDGVRDPDEFIPDEHGSYYLYEETLDDYKPVNVVHLLSKVSLDIPAGRLFTFGGKDLTMRTETSFEVREKSSASAEDVFLLKLNSFRKAGKTTSGDVRIQEDITVPLYRGDGSLRLRLFYLDSYNAEFVSGAEIKGTSEQSLRLRLPVSDQSDTEITISRSIWKRTMEHNEAGNFEVQSLSGITGFSYYPEPTSTIGISFGGGYDHERISGTAARFVVLKPTFTYRFSGRGKIETAYVLTSVTLKNSNPGFRIPYTMARGRKEGENHDISLTFDYRLSNRINIIATYSGRILLEYR